MSTRLVLFTAGAIVAFYGSWWLLHRDTAAPASAESTDPNLAADPEPATPAKSSASVEDYAGMEEFGAEKVHVMTLPGQPGVTAAVLRKLPSWRKHLTALAHEKDFSPAFIDAEFKTNFVNTVVDLLGDNKAKPRISKQYFSVYHRLDRRLPYEVCAIRRVYILEQSKFEQDIHGGAKASYAAFFRIEKGTGQIDYSWSLPERLAAKAAVDLPVFINVGGHFDSADALVGGQFDKRWLPTLETATKSACALVSYQFVDGVAGEAIEAAMPKQCPSWFSSGLRYFGDMTVLLKTGIGGTEPEIVDNLQLILPRAVKGAANPSIRLESWSVGKVDPALDDAYKAASAFIFFHIAEQLDGNANWMGEVLSRVHGRDSIDNREIRKILLDVCHFDIGPVLAGQLKT